MKNFFEALLHDDWRNRINSFHSHPCSMYERRRSSKRVHHFNDDFRNRDRYFHSSYFWLSVSRRSVAGRIKKINNFLISNTSNRLPIVQGGTISFLIPTLAILNQPQWRCPSSEILDAMSYENRTEVWQIRMRELSGAIAVSAVFQTVIGYCGTLCRYVKKTNGCLESSMFYL